MKRYRKFIVHRDGFTMLEVLISLLALSFAIVLLSYCIQIMAAMSWDTYASEDRIAIHQLRILLAQSEDLHITKEALTFQRGKQAYTLQFHNHRLVKRKGYEIYLKDIDDVLFTQEGACIHVQWTREQKQKEALLHCE